MYWKRDLTDVRAERRHDSNKEQAAKHQLKTMAKIRRSCDVRRRSRRDTHLSYFLLFLNYRWCRIVGGDRLFHEQIRMRLELRMVDSVFPDEQIELTWNMRYAI